MADENIVPLSHANESDAQALSINVDGRPVRIDLVTGHLFDKFGNDAGRLPPMEESRVEEQNKALGRALHRKSAAQTACSINGCCVSERGQEYVRSVADQYHALSLANNDERIELLESGKITPRVRMAPPKFHAFMEKLVSAPTAQKSQMLAAATPEDILMLEQAMQALDVGPSDVHIPSGLTNFVTGYNNEGPLADVFSPPLVVAKKSDYFWQYAKEDAFQRALPQLGAPAGGVPEIFPRFGNTKFTAIQRAIGAFVPTEVEANQDAPLQMKLAHSDRMVDAAALEREFRVQAVARASGNWNAATTLLANFQWNGGSSSDPVKDFHTVQESSYGNPNAAIIPEHIWNAMTRNPGVRSYYTYGGTSPGILSEQQMASILKLPEIYISRKKYIDSTGALKYVWGNDVVIFRRPLAMPPVNQRDVCTSVTFRWAMGANVPDGKPFTPDMADGRGWIMRQFFNQLRGGLGGIQMVLAVADAETTTSKYIGNVLINAFQ